MVRCGEATREFRVTICPVDDWLLRARDEFYRSAIDFSRVRVKESRLVLSDPGTGWTCNDVIRFKRARTADDLPKEHTLIHELGHVWQHQTGQAQLLKGIVEQVGRAFGKDPYDFGGPERVREANTLTDFPKESQAEIVRAYWLSQRDPGGGYGGAPFSTPGYVDDLRRLVEGAGIGRPAASGTTRPPIRLRSVAASIDGAVAKLVNAVLR